MAIRILCLTLLLGGRAWAWYSDQFEFRRTLKIDTTASGAEISENLSEVPVLIRLHSGNFDFSRVMADGKDLRFLLPDDKTVLRHYIERFDPLEELGFVWVNLPKISGNANEEFIYLYYGNGSATDGQSPSGTHDQKSVGVYHLNETEGTPKDTSPSENTPVQFTGGLGFPGVIGNGTTLNGTSDRMLLKSAPSLVFKDGLTVSLWVKISGSQNNAFLFHQQASTQTLFVGIDGTKIYAGATLEDGKSASTDRSLDLPFESWHHLTVTFAPGDRITLFLDGIQMGWASLPFTLSENQGEVTIGAGPNGNYFAGDLDEVVLSNTPRNPAYVGAQFASQGPNGSFLTVGEEVTGGGGSDFSSVFLAMLLIVMKNITLDGWVIIGILGFMSIICWIIILQKSYFFVMTERQNQSFLKAFEGLPDLLGLMKKEENFSGSPLFKIYCDGCRELNKDINKLVANSESDRSVKQCVTGKRMGVFKAALEKGFVNEGKYLNGGLMMLTLSISGGPFLGLLGTVWGVMTTFAAMAESGEASIMAIAPGVASALATTVVGLLVAIPSSFAYNYLAGKAKNMISDISVFIDEFSVKADEQYGEGS